MLNPYFKLLVLFTFNITIITAQNKEVVIKNIEINDEYSTFSTSYYKDNFIIFTSPKRRLYITNKEKRQRLAKRLNKVNLRRKNRILNRIKNRKKRILRSDLEFYIGFIDSNGEIVKSKPLSNLINTKNDELDVVFTNSLKTVYFTINSSNTKSKTHLELYKASVITTGYWVNIIKLPINNKYYSVGYPALSTDGSELYFASNKKGSFGLLDLFKVKIMGDNAFGKPINLGANINTNNQETTPYILNDTLYFSSNRKGGFGQLDIYKVSLKNKNDKPVLLDKPINSLKNDFAFKFKLINNLKQGYLTSNRNGSKGNNDIYFFKETQKLKDSTSKKKPLIVTKLTTILKDTLVKTVANKKIDSVTIAQNLIKPTTQKNKILNDSINNLKKIVITKTKNIDSLKLAVKKIKLPRDKRLSLEEYNRCKTELTKIKNIYFNYDKSYIRQDAARELDNVIGILRHCPNIELLISSHTDSRSSHKYNKALSQRRAVETVAYILRNGHFEPRRVKGIGYGETHLKNRCSDGVKCTQIEHQVNRRTEFKIANY